MGRAPCCDKANVKKGPWSPEEDAKLKSYIDQHGTGGNWIALPPKIGLKRCGKSCRLRWLNYLRPNIKHGGFSDEEDNIICSLYITIGSRWSIIAAQLPGRTDNDIKNYWNTRLKKKLLGKQRREKNSRGKESSTARKGKQNMFTAALTTAAPPPPPPPVVLHPIPYSNEEPRFNNHASIRRLLMKLGGRFSSEEEEDEENPNNQHLKPNQHHHHNQYPTIDDHQVQVQDPLLQSMCIDSNTNPSPPLIVISSSDQIPLLDAMRGPHSFDYSAAMYENNMNMTQRMQGLEFFYDDFVNNRSSGEGVSNWEEMNSWGCFQQ